MPVIGRTLDLLRRFPADLRRHLEDAPGDAIDFRPPSWDGIPSEALTVRQQICHLRDIEIDGYARRFERILNENSPALEAIDTYALIGERAYDNTDIEHAFAAFEAARRDTVRLLDSVKSAELDRPADFDGYGRVTLKGLIHFLASHDQQHLAGIQWLIGKFASRP